MPTKDKNSVENLKIRIEELEKENTLLRLLTENTIDILFLLDSEANFLYLSNSFETETGHPIKKMIGKNIKNILTKESFNNAMVRLEKWSQGVKSLPNYEIQIRTSDNKLKDYEVATFPIFEQGRLKFITGTARNTAEKKLIEDKLVESEKLYRTLAETSQDVIWITDMKGKFRYVSPSVEKLRGYMPEEVMKQSLTEAICPGSLPAVLKGYVLAKNKKKEDILKKLNPAYEVEQPCKDGSTVWTEVIAEVILDEKDKKVGILGVSRDISERKKSQEVIVKLNETLKLLNKIMRHDIANNLTVTLMSLELIDTENNKLKDKAIRSIYKSIELIEKMRELENAISSGGETKSYNLKVIIENTIKEYRDTKFNINGNCNVIGDNALASVIDNIVRNAIVHGKTDRIRFDISEEGKNCILKISDYGKGIPEGIKHRIFDEGFSYGDQLSSGLGLFIVKKTIERYGGKIYFEDNKPKGTVFVITLMKAD